MEGEFSDRERELGRMLVAITQVCNEGPYSLDFVKSTSHEQVYHCQACGAELHFGNMVSIPTWMHYKPITTVAAEIIKEAL